MRYLRFVPFAALLFLHSQVFAQDDTKDLTQLLQSQKNLSQFTALLTSYGDIYANLSFQSGVTVLAPNNDAFNKIPYSSLGPAFEANQSQIVRSVLQYHILPGIHRSGSYNGSFSFDQTWLQNASYTNVTGGQVVGGVQQAGDVNIYTSGMGSRSTLVNPIRSIKLMKSIQNLAFTGGVVHVIDTFLMPPANFIQSVPQFNLTAAGGAVENASLADYVNTHPDLTVFVPNNAAFLALGSTLQSMPLQQLRRILDYHIVNASTVGYSSNLPNGTVLRTRSGENLTITFASNSLFVNQARVIQQDLLIANGVMHIIDNFLSPDAPSATANPEVPTAPPLIQGTSLSENVVPFTSFLPTGVTSFDANSATPTSSFGVSDIGKGTSAFGTGTTGARASSTHTSSKKKSKGVRVQLPPIELIGLGSLVVSLCLLAGIL
ncbi:MAG: hypothetical protein LQ350_002157 [Teloschistes chrysophthalmus]|nr:MAG: hypothetical protein LQ350_002157 [Niorma chrysophthalma]